VQRANQKYGPFLAQFDETLLLTKQFGLPSLLTESRGSSRVGSSTSSKIGGEGSGASAARGTTLLSEKALQALLHLGSGSNSGSLKVYIYKLPQFDAYLAKYGSCRDSQWSGDVKLVEWLRERGRAYTTNNPEEADFLLVPFLFKVNRHY
jgi:hypothetical protein